jgi:uncharacterized protein
MPDVDVSCAARPALRAAYKTRWPNWSRLTPPSAGQYQHDVNQFDLARSLDTVVEDCVNSVGVDLNTASALLLARVSARRRRLSVVARLARREWRVCQRADLLKVITCRKPEQSAGFYGCLRSNQPGHAAFTETYAVVEKSWRTPASQ